MKKQPSEIKEYSESLYRTRIGILQLESYLRTCCPQNLDELFLSHWRCAHVSMFAVVYADRIYRETVGITLCSWEYDPPDRITVRGRFTDLKRHIDNKSVGFENIFGAEPYKYQYNVYRCHSQ